MSQVEDKTVAEMTAAQLKSLIQSAVKEAFQEVLMDPDADLELRPEFEEKLHQAVAYVASGGRLLSMEELTGQLERAEGVVGVDDDAGGQRKAQRMKNG